MQIKKFEKESTVHYEKSSTKGMCIWLVRMGRKCLFLYILFLLTSYQHVFVTHILIWLCNKKIIGFTEAKIINLIR